MSALERLLALEDSVDRYVRELAIARMPARALLAALHLVIHGQQRLASDPGAPLRAIALAGRLPALIPILRKCPTEPFGSSALDVVTHHNEIDPRHEQLVTMLMYAHYSELMPELRRRYYSVSAESQGFRLDHVSDAFADCEVRDIVLSDLASPFRIPVVHHFEPLFDAVVAEDSTRIDFRRTEALYWSLYELHRQAVVELPLVSDPGFPAAFHCERDEFERVRAALYAIADVCLGLEGSIWRAYNARDGTPDFETETEWLEWVSIAWKWDFFRGLVAALSSVDRSVVDRLLSLYTLDLRPSPDPDGVGGDGFLPPFARLGEAVVFNPGLAQIFLLERNVWYVLNARDRHTFDGALSRHLEPALIEQAAAVLKRLKGVEVRTNVRWSGGAGEFDLLAYSKTENTALHVQAKASLPPQGARLTERVQQSAIGGLNQLARFRALPRDTQDRVLSQALGRNIRGAEVVDLLLARANFGGASLWLRTGDVAAANLSLLALLVRENPNLSLRDVPQVSKSRLDLLIRDCGATWSHQSISVGGVSLRAPILTYDDDRVIGERSRATAYVLESLGGVRDM